MRRRTWKVIAWVLALCAAAGAFRTAVAQPDRFEQLLKAGGLELFVWTDVCNVYVLRDGKTAVLVDLGNGSVLDHLSQIGVEQVDWVLLTHHHREQCQVATRLASWQQRGTQVACPAAERALLERPADFRKLKPSLGDAFTVHGASYVRPPVEPLAVQRAFTKMDTFTWRGRELWCLETAGNSPGSMSYLLNTAQGWLAFSGDVMLAGRRMHNWFDTEWDYGFAKGLYRLIESVSLLARFDPALLLPSHGPVVRQAAPELEAYQQKLRQLARLYVRGYQIFTFAGADQDKLSRPSAIPHLWQTTPHLFKFKGPEHSPNFYLLLADSGRALLVDCGVDKAALDTTFQQLRERKGLKAIDAILVTHMHGDHVLTAPYVREKWGAKLWTLDRVAEKFEQPERFNYAALVPAYRAKGIESVKFDRVFRSGEKFLWEGYELCVDWMPGQTEFGCSIQGQIDGRRVAFTGDNLFADPEDPTQDGHEAVCARNSAILEEGYIYAAEYLRRLQPDLILGGHSFVMDRPHDLIERYYRWSLAIRGAYQDLSAEEDYRTMFDPYWVRADPWRTEIAPGDAAAVTIHVRNFLKRPQPFRLAMHCPAGLVAEPAVLEGTTPAEASIAVPLRIKAASAARPGVRIVALDTTIAGKRYGEWFDLIVAVRAGGAVRPPSLSNTAITRETRRGPDRALVNSKADRQTRGSQGEFVFDNHLWMLGVGSTAPVAPKSPGGRHVRLLAVGNSFSGNATRFLGDLVAASPGGNRLTFGHAYIGGCTLEKHVRLAEAFEKDTQDPLGRPYSGKSSLRDLLQRQKWDYVTIQQASMKSFDLESYRPWARKLYGYIKRYAPQAEVLIHQTWAYREDDPLFRNGTSSADGMHRRLSQAYATIAAELGCRVIPVGDAFQFVRLDPAWRFDASRLVDPKAYQYPKIPEQARTLHAGWRWSTREGRRVLANDTHHASLAGQYLAACVWFESLYAQGVVGNTFVASGLRPEDARILQEAAHRVVGERARSVRPKDTQRPRFHRLLLAAQQVDRDLFVEADGSPMPCHGPKAAGGMADVASP